MPADALELLRRNDPARSLALLDPAERERTRRAIVAVPTAERRKHPRRLVLVAAALLAAVFVAGGWTAYQAVFGPTADDVRRDFASVTRDIPLPAGASWSDPQLDENGVYPGPAALMTALLQATCAWTGDWNAAYAAGDAARMTADVAGMTAVRQRMPLHREGQSEDVGGFDATSLAFYDAMIGDMRHGRPGSARQYLKANC